MYTQQDIHQIVEKQRAYFKTGQTLDLSYRIAQLKKLKKGVIAYSERFIDLLRHGGSGACS